MKRKEISIYIVGGCNSQSEEKEGYYAAELRYKDKSRFIGRNIDNTTSNRVVIEGLIDTIKILKEPCIIQVYTAGTYGYKSMYNKRGQYRETITGVNNDLLSILQKQLIENNHILLDNRSNKHTKRLKEAYMRFKIKQGGEIE